MNQIQQVLYTGRTQTTGGRDGRSHSDDGRLNIQLSRFGSAGPGTNPEQLFAAGWSACFIGALGRAAATRQVKLPADVGVDAEVDLGTGEGANNFLLQARLHVRLPGIDRQTGEELIAAAHQICPYSKATRGNIDVQLVQV